MNRKKISKTKNSQNVRREQDSIPWRYCFLTLICGLILAAGFFLAARQHFTSIDYSIKNSQLRKQKNELETAQRQLLLAKEIALSPAEIKKVAKEYGYTEIAGAVQAVYPTEKTNDKPKIEKSSEARTNNSNTIVRKEEKKPEKEVKTEKNPAENVNSKNKKGN